MQAGEGPLENVVFQELAETCKDIDETWKGLTGTGMSFKLAEGMDKT